MDSPLSVAIKEIRKARGLTQVKFAAELGVKDLTVKRWESGTFKPNSATLASLYMSAREIGRDDLAAVFLRSGVSEVVGLASKDGMNGLSAEVKDALGHASSLFGQITMALTNAEMTPAVDEKLRLMAEAQRLAIEGGEFMRRVLREIETAKENK